MKSSIANLTAGFFICLLFVVILYNTTKNYSNTQTLWYPESGFIILKKEPGEFYGKWRYKIKDDSDDPEKIDYYIRANDDWNQGDTIRLTTK